MLAQPERGPGQPDAVPVDHLPVRKGRLGRMASGPLTMLRARRGKPALVYVVAFDLLPWAFLLKKLTRIHVLYDSSEQYDEYMLTKVYLPRRLLPILRWIVFHVEPWLVSKFDGATTAVPVTQEKFLNAGVRSVMVRNFPPRSVAEFSVRRESPEYDILVGGSLHHDGVPVLVETAAELGRMGFGDARWLAICRNYGEKEQAFLERSLEEAGVRDNFELRYNRPFKEVQELTTRARVGFIGYPVRPYYQIALPIRVFEYMAVGLPFVTGRFPLVEQLLRGEDVGILAPAGDAHAYAASLAELLGDAERQARMSERGPELVRDEYNWDAESEKLLALADDVLGTE